MQTTQKRKEDLIETAEFYLDMLEVFDMKGPDKSRVLRLVKSMYRKAMEL